jgi:hypothetical protein
VIVPFAFVTEPSELSVPPAPKAACVGLVFGAVGGGDFLHPVAIPIDKTTNTASIRIRFIPLS